MSKITDYIEKYAKGAVFASRGTTILPETIICQSAVESGWGESSLAKNYNNFFGIKGSKNYKGKTVILNTREFVNGNYTMVSATFRAYSSFAESAADYVNLLKSNSRYTNVFNKKDIYSQLVALQVAGYSTTPTYATYIYNVYTSNKTTIDLAIKKAKDNLALTFAAVGVGVYFLIRKYLPQIVKSAKG